MIYSFSLFHLSVCLNWSSGNISFHRFQCNRHANHLHKSHDTPTWVSTRHNHGNILACRFCCFRIVDHFCKNPYHPTTCLSQSPRRSHLPMSLLQSWLGNKLGLKIIFYDFQISSHFFIFFKWLRIIKNKVEFVPMRSWANSLIELPFSSLPGNPRGVGFPSIGMKK